MKTCLNNQCAKSLENNFLICPYCGTPQRRQPTRRARSAGATATPANAPSANLMQCERCGSTQVQKVSAIYRSGSWQTEGITAIDGHGAGQHGHALGFSMGQGHSLLASALSPPSAPATDDIGRMVCTATALMFGGLASHPMVCGAYNFISGCFNSFADAPGLYDLFSMIFGGVLFYLSVRWLRNLWKRNPDLPAQQERYEQELSRWYKTWYCHQCDSIFLPSVAPQSVS